MDEIAKIEGYFADIQTTKEHNGYYYSVWEALTVVIPGSLCGLQNVSQINQWSEDWCVRNFLLKHFGIERIPCYYWLLCLHKLIEPVLLNMSLTRWAQSMLPRGTIRSTAKMDKYQSPLHIISAHVAELGITLASRKVEEKSNEIPTLRQLLESLAVG